MITNFLPCIVFLLIMIVGIGFVNEKVTKLTYEIALMLFSVVTGAVGAVIIAGSEGTTVSVMLSGIAPFDLESFLLKGVLCFMLFAGSCHMKLSDFKRLLRPVGVLAFLCTFLGAAFYGLLFFLVSHLFRLGFSLPVCLMFGSIVAPTDPIAATSILNKFGLPEDTGFIIEGESLFNDGVGVALFVCFSGMVSGESGTGFAAVLLREILGAVIIGIAVSLLSFIIFKRTEDIKRKIYTSLLTVTLAYLLCETFDCSGAIASVVCGITFSTLLDKEQERVRTSEMQGFDLFWAMLDNFLNSMLYVILGFSFVRILEMPYVAVLSLMAILCNLAARFGSVAGSTFFMGPLPDGYDRLRFSSLLTWGGLKGGLSIALAMSTASILDDDIYHIVIGCTYAIVFFTTVIQGLSMQKVYDRFLKVS